MDVGPQYAVGEYKVSLQKQRIYDSENVEGFVIAPWKNLKRKQVTQLYVKLFVEEHFHYGKRFR
jgi:hypothetical protein